jgi:hypothetical protein
MRAHRARALGRIDEVGVQPAELGVAGEVVGRVVSEGLGVARVLGIAGLGQPAELVIAIGPAALGAARALDLGDLARRIAAIGACCKAPSKGLKKPSSV